MWGGGEQRGSIPRSGCHALCARAPEMGFLQVDVSNAFNTVSREPSLSSFKPPSGGACLVVLESDVERAAPVRRQSAEFLLGFSRLTRLAPCCLHVLFSLLWEHYNVPIPSSMWPST